MRPIIFPLLRPELMGVLGIGPFTPALHPQGFLDTFTPRWYINPGSGSGANNGKRPADAFNNATTAWADAIAASSAAGGNEFYVLNTSNCSNSSAQTLTFKGTVGNPDRVFSCTFANDPPTQADLTPSGTTGAQFTTTGNSNVNVNGVVEVWGVMFNVGTGANAASFVPAGVNGSYVTLNNCIVNLLSTGQGLVVVCSNGNIDAGVIFTNTPVTFNGNSSTGIFVAGRFTWRYTPNAVQGTQNAIASLITFTTGIVALTLIDEVDFIGGTGIASGKNLLNASSVSGVIQIVNCKINTGVLIPKPTRPSLIIDQIVTDSGATGYKQQRDMLQGTLMADPLRYNNASDGTTPISWQVLTTANANPQNPFECFMIPQWIPTAGVYTGCKIYLTSTNAGLRMSDVWVDFDYLGANYALGSTGTTFGAGTGLGTLSQLPAGTKANPLIPAGIPWAVGSLGSDYELDLPSFTTSAPGLLRCFVKIGKPSILVNVDGAVKVAP